MAAPFGVAFSLGGIVLEMDPVRGTRGSWMYALYAVWRRLYGFLVQFQS